MHFLELGKGWYMFYLLDDHLFIIHSGSYLEYTLGYKAQYVACLFE